jgi:predicted transcriptional regulator
MHIELKKVVTLEPDISFVASLIGDPTRACMLTALMGGKALTATELAVEANVTSQTASSHLSKLVDGQLLVVRKQGRHKYFQLKGFEVAELIEKLLTMTAKNATTNISTGPSDPKLKQSRICYDHLAGEIAVALYDSLAKQEYIVDKQSETLLTDLGKTFFNDLGADVENMPRNKRPVCKSCLDWSERRNHLSGRLGQWILNDLFSKGWAAKDLNSRVIHFTPKGLALFNKRYGVG